LAEAKPPLEQRSSFGVRVATLPDIKVYCDGACSGNPGPGGWAALLIEGGAERAVAGAEPQTTNQRMEIRAALEGLAAIAGRRRVHVHSDSAYVVNCFRDRWWERWERTGWIGANKQPVANRDLWERLLAETRRHDVYWHKVRGHSGDPLNERVDALARRAIANQIGESDRRSPR
jgi:ribonuclease HI